MITPSAESDVRKWCGAFWSTKKNDADRVRMVSKLFSGATDPDAFAKLEALFLEDERTFGPEGSSILKAFLKKALKKPPLALQGLVRVVAGRIVATPSQVGAEPGVWLMALLLCCANPQPLSTWSRHIQSLAGFSTDNGGLPELLLQIRIADALSDEARVVALLEQLVTEPATDADLSIAHTALGRLLARWGHLPRIARLAEALHRLDPRHRQAIHNFGCSADASGRNFSDLVGIYDALDPATPPEKACKVLSFAVGRLTKAGMVDHAASLLRRYPAPFWPRSVQVTRRALLGEPPEPESDPVPALEDPSDPISRLAHEAIGQSSLHLEHGDAATDAIEQQFRELVACATALPPEAGASAKAWLDAAKTCRSTAKSAFGSFTRFVDLQQAQPDRAYGSVDFRALRASHDGLVAVAAALAGNALQHILCDVLPCQPREVAQLAELHTFCKLAIGSRDEAEAMLNQFAGHGIAELLMNDLRRMCRMQSGDLAESGSCDFDPPGARALYVADRDEWTRREGLEWTTVLETASQPGTFDVLWPDGELQHHEHWVPRLRVDISSPRVLLLLNNEVIIGDRGGILRPQLFHLSGDYPPLSARLVAGQGKGAVVDVSDAEEITEPVLLLETFDALQHRNYFHWMAQILPRMVLALERGVLTDRRLVVPSGLSSWMTETMRLCGLPDDRLLTLPPNRLVRFRDAIIMSSVEVTAKALLRPVIDRLLAGVRPLDPDQPRNLFLSRKWQRRRQITNEAEIEALACQMGFAIIHPETLPIPEQIQLFRGARCIVGGEGAALTNTLFCPPGARVVAILCERDMLPVFNELSIALGHEHLKVACASVPEPNGRFRVWSRHVADPEQITQALTWALDQKDG